MNIENFRHNVCAHNQNTNLVQSLQRKKLSQIPNQNILHRLQFNTSCRGNSSLSQEKWLHSFLLPSSLYQQQLLLGPSRAGQHSSKPCCQIRFCLFSKLNWLSDTFHKWQLSTKEGTGRSPSVGSCQLSVTPLAEHTATSKRH